MNNRKRTALCLLGAALCVFMTFGAALALGRYPITPAALLAGDALPRGEGVADPSCLAMTTESLTREYPLYTPSLLNLVKTSETRARELTGEDRT